MHVIDLALKDGLMPEQIPNSNQDKYLSACPGCCGSACFVIWKSYNRYYCMRCQRRGDQVQYLRDFHTLSYREACKEVGESTENFSRTPLLIPCNSLEILPRASKPFVVLDDKTIINLLEQCAGDLCYPITTQQLDQNFIYLNQTSLILFASKDSAADCNRYPILIVWPLPATLTGIVLRKWVLSGFRAILMMKQTNLRNLLQVNPPLVGNSHI